MSSPFLSGFNQRITARQAYDRVRRVIGTFPDGSVSLDIALAIVELSGREQSGLTSYVVETDEGPRFYLVDPMRLVLDLVTDKGLRSRPDYTQGRRCELPSKLTARAQRIVDDVHERFPRDVR